jgi:hypothetical protein
LSESNVKESGVALAEPDDASITAHAASNPTHVRLTLFPL